MLLTTTTLLIFALGTIGAIWATTREHSDHRERMQRAAEYAAYLRGG